MSEAPATTSTHDAASNGEQHAVPKATFELPRESAKTVLKKEERTYVIDLVTGKTALEPVAKDTQTEKLVLLCIEPDTQHGQTEVGLRHVICIGRMQLTHVTCIGSCQGREASRSAW